jgi:uncharacterized protein involved in exopolysaccharide biosynthesis
LDRVSAGTIAAPFAIALPVLRGLKQAAKAAFRVRLFAGGGILSVNSLPVPPRAEDAGGQYGDALPIDRFRSDIWASRLLVAAATVIGIALGALMSFLSPRSYDASVMVAPVAVSAEDPSSQQLRNLAASVAGVAIANRPDTAKFDSFEHMLSSIAVAERLERDHQVLQHVYVREWDAADQRWIAPTGTIATIRSKILAAFGVPAWAPPSPESLAGQLKRQVKIVTDPRSSIITLTYANKDPAFATEMLQWLCDETDHVLKERDQQATKAQIDYIDARLQTIQVEEHRRALGELLLDLERKAMITAIDQPYAATIIDGPRAPDLPSSPRPFVSLAVGLLGGFTVGCMIALYRRRRRGLRPAAG